MSKRKKVCKRCFLFLAAAVLLVSMALMAGCGDDGEQNKQGEEKYDVVVKVKNSLGEEWIFDLETKELSVEYEYTGQEIDFYVDSCNMPNHPLFHDNWVTGGAGIGFDKSCLYYDTEGIQDKNPYYRVAKERGTYSYLFEPMGSAYMLKYRAVYLIVVIK